MNIQALTQSAIGASERFLKKNGPLLLTGGGLAGFGVTTVLVGKAVLKAQPIVGAFKANKASIERVVEANDFDKKEIVKETGQLYITTAQQLTKVFWPALAVGVVSAAAIVSAHGLMRRREASLVAAYTALDAGFKAYRKRVAEELGEDRELEFYRGVRSSKDGVNDAGVPCVINEYDAGGPPSPYARFFDEASSNWTKTPEYNLMFLTAQQQHANDLLRARGHVFLNEVYDMLDLPRSQAGQIVGWKFLDEGNGDGYIDFGLYTSTNDDKRAFINGGEPSVLLDFNVDGPITI